MDFISLASATNNAIENGRRHFVQSGLLPRAIDYDDPWALIERRRISEVGSSSSLNLPQVSASGTVNVNRNTFADEGQQRPLLSPSAEAELFLLATNFLLYVAMVIIITMIAKIYFPESLERGRQQQEGRQQRGRGNSSTAQQDGVSNSSTSAGGGGGGGTVTGTNSAGGRGQGSQQQQQSRSVSYRMVDVTSSTADESDEEDEGDSSGSNEVDDDDDVDEEAGDETANLLGLDEEDVGGVGGDDIKSGKRKTKKRMTSSPLSRDHSGRFLLDAAAGSGHDGASRGVVMKRLGFCFVMLNVTFVTWGVLQERMLTRRYPRFTGEYFTYSYALVFTNRFWTLIMSGLLLLYMKPTRSRSTVIYEYSFPSISNMLSSWCQYEALRYVSFPATTLFKSFKLAPVMAMGKILGNREYPQYDYVVAVIIGAGLAMFMTSTDDLRLGYDIYGEETFDKKWTGVLMLCLYLFFDSFTGQWQSRMFSRHRDLSMIELLFATSAFSTVLSLVTLIHTKELGPALNFVYRHSEIHAHFFLFSICSTIGQLTIFYTIKNFGAVVFSLIMTTRVLLSIALSCVLYGHQVTSTGFLGLMTVIGAVIYRVKRKAEGTQLIKWQGMGDEKAVELVQEWHEHLDM